MWIRGMVLIGRASRPNICHRWSPVEQPAESGSSGLFALMPWQFAVRAPPPKALRFCTLRMRPDNGESERVFMACKVCMLQVAKS
eukprot:7377913-Prymnesium_polylepis.1